MLNARTLAQAPTAGDTSGSDVAEAPGAPSEDLRPVEAFRTKEGVIVLSNRPPGDEAAAAAAPSAPPPAAATAPTQLQARPQPATPAIAPTPARDEPAADAGAGLWLLLAAVAAAIATVALLLVRRKRRRTTERYAALLAGSEPIAPEPEHVGPYSRRGGAPVSRPLMRSAAVTTPSPAGRTPLPNSSLSEERSSPQSAPPPSGISAPPVSERQWLSQRPPRSYKEPPS